MKFTLDTVYHWTLPGGIEGWSYGSKDVSPVASASMVNLDGRHGKSKSLVNDRVMYILDGEGEFVLEMTSSRCVRPMSSSYRRTLSSTVAEK